MPAITYEESESPPLAVAEPGTTIPEGTHWVQENQEPLLLRDSKGSYMLIRLDSSGSPGIEPPGKILNVKDVRLAASRFRELLRRQQQD